MTSTVTVELTEAEQRVLASYGRRVPVLVLATTQNVDEVWAQAVVDRYAAGDHMRARTVARNAQIVAAHEAEPAVAVVAEPPEPTTASVIVDEESPPVEPAAAEPEPPQLSDLGELLRSAATLAWDPDVAALLDEITKRGAELAALLRDRERAAQRIPDLVAAVAAKWRAECETRCTDLADETKLANSARTWARAHGKDCTTTGATPPTVIVDYLEALLAAVDHAD